MKINSVEKIETNKVQLEIAVDAQTFEQAISRVYKKQVKNINVPGFRKGKAPQKMIEKLYGEGVFFEDAINELYPQAMEEAIKEQNLEIVARPEVEIVSVSKADGFVLKAICVTKPEVEVKAYKGLKVEKEAAVVTEEEVMVEVNRAIERNARVVTVERKAKKGDIAVIDFEGFVDGKAFEGGKGENHSLTLGSGQFIPGFEEQVIGKKAGEECDVNVTFPAEYHASDLAGKEAVFKVKVHEVQAKELPELDDEFVKDISEFDTVDEYKADIRNTMQQAKDNAANNDVENKLVDMVIENMTGEIPNEMYEARIDEMVSDFDMRLQQQGLKLDMYLQYTGMDLGSFRKTFEEQAQKAVKIRLALEKVVELEKIEATDDDVNAEYEKIAQRYSMPAEEVKKYIPVEDLTKDLKVNKAIDLIKDSAVVKEVAKKAPAKKTTTTKTAKATDEKAEPAKKPAAKKTTTTTKSTAAKSTATKSTTAKSTTATKSTAAKKTTTTKAATEKKATTTKAPAKKTTTKKAEADK
ncbi:MAG: trigger factor [Oscillospiraceae bacterium]|nr:trigger factor [Oscillospiraceae bacterium]